MSKYKYLIGTLALAVVVYLALTGHSILGIEYVHAQVGAVAEGDVGKALVGFMQIIGGITVGLQVLLLISMWMLQFLLSADFFTNPAMMEMLNNIWTLSRDIMNLIFAIMLIGVAFYTIIVAKGDFVREKIGTFVLAVILVNFSWFFPRVILDISAVLTATIYDIPANLPGYQCRTLDEKDNVTPVSCQVLTNITLLPTPVDEGIYGAFPRCPKSPMCGDCLTGIACYQLVDISSPDAAKLSKANKMINGLMVSFGRVHQLARVPDTTIVDGKTGGELVKISLLLMVSLLFVVFFQVAMIFPLIGLTIGLLLRILILWATMAFMPFAFVGYVINGKLGTNVFNLEDYVWDNFVSAAFLPALVAVPFTIGMIMLSGFTTIDPTGFSDAAGEMIIKTPLINGVKTWWALMWMIAAVMIIYTGTFAALARNKIIGGFTDKIKDYGRMLGSAAMKLPMLTPIPLPAGKGTAPLGSVINLPREANLKLSALTQVPLIDKLTNKPGGGAIGGGKTAEDGAKALDNNKQVFSDMLAELKKLEEIENKKQREDQIKIVRDRAKIAGVDLQEGKELENLARIARESERLKINRELAEMAKKLEDGLPGKKSRKP